MLEIVGWIGSICFSLCALPQAVKTYKTRSAGDFSWGFLGLWTFGEIATLIYVLCQNVQSGAYQFPLLINYQMNLFILCFLIYAKFSYKE